MAYPNWQEVKDLLADALEEEPADRAAFIGRSCGGNTTLMREIESLLAQETAVLESCAANRTASAAGKEAAKSGQRFGSYEVIRELGRGGMGAVYLARRADGEFEKEVALKLLKRGTDTEEVLRRFGVERRILARLEHPNIARLLDAGTTDDGLPFFVMEYVEGEPVTTFARARAMPIAERLQLFLKVCEAVELAHQHLVVHRDLKPPNILVTDAREPKLLDFGIAKVLDPASDADQLTMTSERRMTPVCASPEQARGEAVTTTSDVYALGALLYELLTDAAPHRFASSTPTAHEMMHVICEQEPIRPSLAATTAERRRELRGDLDNITLLALRKEPVRRYASVSEFAEDIRRSLNRHPIRARPNTAGYVGRRFIARHKTTLALTAMGFILVTAAGAALVWQMSKTAERSATLRGEAEALLADFGTQWRAGNSAAALADSQRAAALLHEVAAGRPDDAGVQVSEGRAYQYLAIAQRARGDLPGATGTYTRAENLYRTLLAKHDDESYRVLLQAMQRERAVVGDIEGAAAAQRVN
ncbi:MAG: serine/threonine protein kinase [Verrucomicrobiota bacterium]|nr:serine/threonine protein kinase [Verrucomicrobiota bacterium]